jgi:hypothetical protein
LARKLLGKQTVSCLKLISNNIVQNEFNCKETGLAEAIIGVLQEHLKHYLMEITDYG